MARKVILYIAESLDGYIADINGGVDWLKGDGSEPEADIGYEKFYENVDTVIMGNSTYQQILEWGEYPYSGRKGYVYSRKKYIKTEHVEFITESPEKLLKKLKSEPGKDIWLIGGAEIVDMFIKKNLIDEYIITIIPAILGGGICLFKKDNPEIDLTLIESKVFDGMLQGTYIRREK